MTNEQMNKVELLFLGKAIRRGTIIKCERQQVVILGIDGFYLTDTTTQPSMENSVDYSVRHFDKDLYQNAIRFLEERDQNLHFEIVC